MRTRTVLIALALTLLPWAFCTVVAAPPPVDSQSPKHYSPSLPTVPGQLIPNAAVKRPPVLRRYAGSFQLDGRREKIEEQYIADECKWGVVWQILCGQIERPVVDFEKEIVLVGIIGDENDVSLDTTLGERGELELIEMGTLVGYSAPTTDDQRQTTSQRDLAFHHQGRASTKVRGSSFPASNGSQHRFWDHLVAVHFTSCRVTLAWPLSVPQTAPTVVPCLQRLLCAASRRESPSIK